VVLGESANDDVLPAAEWASDLDPIAQAQFAVRLCRLAVDVDLPALACSLRLRAGFEEAADIQPEIEAHAAIESTR
jgi:hypothetical protein